MPIIRATLKRKEFTMDLTICYRFEDTYTAEFIGINNCQDPEVEAVTIEAAKSFTDMGGERHSYMKEAEKPLGKLILIHRCVPVI